MLSSSFGTFLPRPLPTTHRRRRRRHCPPAGRIFYFEPSPSPSSTPFCSFYGGDGGGGGGVVPRRRRDQLLGPGHRRRATPVPLLRFPSSRTHLRGPSFPCLLPATKLLFFLWLRPLLVMEQGIVFR